MEIRISGTNDLLWELQSLLPPESITQDATNTNLNIGGEPWFYVDAATFKKLSDKTCEILMRFARSRPKSRIIIGGVDILLENVSEELIESTIEKAIEYSTEKDSTSKKNKNER